MKTQRKKKKLPLRRHCIGLCAYSSASVFSSPFTMLLFGASMPHGRVYHAARQRPLTLLKKSIACLLSFLGHSSRSMSASLYTMLHLSASLPLGRPVRGPLRGLKRAIAFLPSFLPRSQFKGCGASVAVVRRGKSCLCGCCVLNAAGKGTSSGLTSRLFPCLCPAAESVALPGGKRGEGKRGEMWREEGWRWCGSKRDEGKRNCG